jgi:hypothetical protein
MANAQGYVPGFGGKHNCVKTDFNCGWFLNEFSHIDGSDKRGMFGFGGSITYEHVFKPGIGVGVSAIMDNGNDANVFTYFVGPSFVYAGTHGNWVIDCSAGLGEGGLKYDSGMIIDSTGKKYDGTFYGTHKDQNNWVSYDIADCGFTKFSGTIIMNPNPGGLDTVSPVVVIYENEWNRELYRSEPVKAGSAAQHFEVSLQNTKELKVQISGEYNVRIVDCYLSK